jgi:hypothetical protein
MEPISNATDPEQDIQLQSHSQSLPPPQCQRHPNYSSVSPAPLSKNAIKKAKRTERYAELKLARRAREKEKKKESKRRKALEKQKAMELGLGEDEDEADREGADRGKKRARTDGDRKAKTIEFGGRVVIDLGFDELMNEKVSVSPVFKLLSLTGLATGNCIIDLTACLYL